MRVLLDTHAILWAIEEPSKLGVAATTVILNPANDRLVSAATIWEVAIKFGQGKLSLSLAFRPWIEKAVADLVLTILPITVEYAERQAALPPYHRDPFDRLMISQALVENISVVSADAAFDPYGVSRIWN